MLATLVTREVKQDDCCVQEEQVEYLADSEVDFSSDDDDDEDDMEDFAKHDEGRHSAGHLGKRPSGMLSLQLLCTDTADVTDCAVGIIADGGNGMQGIARAAIFLR